MGQKRFDFSIAHFARMAFVVKKNVTLDPVDVAIPRLGRIVLDLNRIPNLIQEFLGWFIILSLTFGMTWLILSVDEHRKKRSRMKRSWSRLYDKNVVYSIVRADASRRSNGAAAMRRLTRLPIAKKKTQPLASAGSGSLVS
jgi:hypothetical protein